MAFDTEKLKDIPKAPGVYVMKDAKGAVLYVGKAKDLRTRVRSYFREGGDGRPSIRFLRRRIADLEFVVARSEKEALILENNFIKKYRPRYNVTFRDDKAYLHIRIDTSHPFPRAGLIRKPRKDGALYFGPYASSRSVRETLRILQRFMGLRTCKDSQFKNTQRTCLNQQMGRCSGVCRGAITSEEYAQRLQEAVLFLKGRSRELINLLEEKMQAASDALRFEEAARLRDQIQAVKNTVESQRAAVPLGSDRDAVGLFRFGDKGGVSVLRVIKGKVIESLHLPIRSTPLEDEEVLASFIKQFYDSARFVPPEILIPLDIGEERPLLEHWLGEAVGRRVKIRYPQRGEAKDLVDMARLNAEHAISEQIGVGDLLSALARRCKLKAPPRILEGFDISTLGGQDAVGSAVRFTDGEPDRKSYRIYRIRTVEGVDDYAMMYELLTRHLKRREQEDNLPNLIMLDGGKGQLGVARAVLEELGLTELEAVALAKGRGRTAEPGEEQDRVFIPGRKDAIALNRDPAVLRLLQRLRDEAHRFAVHHHRQRRTKRRIGSSLERIAGVGPARRKALLKTFGSLKGLKEAEVREIEAVPGITKALAETIFEDLHGNGNGRERA